MPYISLRCLREFQPAAKWRALYAEFWPAYERWFLSEGHQARPGYLTSRTQLQANMPELIPIYERLVELAGGGDLAARFLSLYCPPPFLPGCSQAVWTRGEPALIRNYDYSPQLFEGILLYTHWLRPVIAMSDTLWGVLDGINDAGLVVSLAFGGRKATGDGFGITLILRYILETCDGVATAVDVLRRIPAHMTYNIALVDASGAFALVHVSPVRPTVVRRARTSTNHQEQVEWPDYAVATATVEREAFLAERLAEGDERLSRLVGRFMAPPLFQTGWERGFGTLYTAVYAAQPRELQLHWPRRAPVRQSFTNFSEQQIDIPLRPMPSYVE